MKVVLVISSLGSGGAERVMSNVANYWAGKRWNVTLITLEDKKTDFFPLDERISRIALGVAGRSTGIFEAVSNNIKRIFSLRSAIKSTQPDAVISFTDRMNVLTLLATRFTGTPVIISERIDPRRHKISKTWRMLRSLLYSKAAALVVQTQNVLSWAVDMVGKEKALVIPNPVPRMSNVSVKEENQFPKPFILAMGRFAPQKGFDLLVRAFRKNSVKHPEWSLVILGEGSERLSLEVMATELGIENRIYLPGRYSNPTEVMAEASVFVLPSRYEGFPNALIEAMACGLPSISFDCPSGPREIIRHGIDGILVPPEDVAALADAMSDLITHPEKRERLASRAIEVMDRYGVNRIMAEWEELAGRVIKK
jgi:glycosyltransferase involved in cell wall biosynthesis